ncbi:nuclease-related domain-containing protein [Fictibacillus sp. b24]|uniref:nuclease-related domain-containing protein n=1 Tax=Fictibacillus sp. b24 TaxID=3055863 RepID=UPI0025A036B9|nr:nuclease-related domain-containing protein [Fictibacillus sp. b24]MDM5318035.1 nuclease-related domain-containing protein [Fictibacillus sp. b24]
MIIKNRSKSLKLLKLEVLLERTSLSHKRRQDFEAEYAKNFAGYKGEASLDYYLNGLVGKDYHIFHDIRLPRDEHHKYFFQIDCLVVHPNFFVLLEVKNLIGNLYFDHQFDQIIRTKDGVDDTFSDPVNQVELQKLHFSKWLVQYKFPKVPIQTFVVVTNPKSFIRISPKYGTKANKIIRGNELAKKLNEYSNHSADFTLFKKDVKKLSKQIMKDHTPNNVDILKSFKIQKNEIITGVECPLCKKFAMIRTHGNWFCTSCQNKSKGAHIKAIQDYALLFGETAKNKELREFLHIDSRTSLKKLMISMDIPPIGTTKAATYTLPLPK